MPVWICLLKTPITQHHGPDLRAQYPQALYADTNISGSVEKFDLSQVNFHRDVFIYNFGVGRADSPRTFSKSCSDKLALRSCTSLLNAFLSNIIDPSSCYLDALIVLQHAYHEAGFHRAFSERLKSVQTTDWPPEYRVRPPTILTTSQILPPTVTPPKPSGLQISTTAPASIVYVNGRQSEVLLNGVKMGSAFPPNMRGTSYLCRVRMAQDISELISHGKLEFPDRDQLAKCTTYALLKRQLGRRSEHVKHSAREALGHWTTNETDGDFTLAAVHPRSTGEY